MLRWPPQLYGGFRTSGIRVRVNAVVRENGAQTVLQNTPGVFNQRILPSSLYIVMYVHAPSTLSHMIHMVQ